MPIYEYRCGACGHYLDALQKLSDAPLTDCPECRAVALKRLISAPSFRLKGSGWYETDFKSDKERRRNLAEGAGAGGDGKSGGDGGSGSDGKPDGAGKEAADKGKGSSGSEGKSDVKADKKADTKPAAKSGDAKAGAGSDKKSESKPGGKGKRSGSEAA